MSAPDKERRLSDDESVARGVDDVGVSSLTPLPTLPPTPTPPLLPILPILPVAPVPPAPALLLNEGLSVLTCPLPILKSAGAISLESAVSMGDTLRRAEDIRRNRSEPLPLLPVACFWSLDPNPCPIAPPPPTPPTLLLAVLWLLEIFAECLIGGRRNALFTLGSGNTSAGMCVRTAASVSHASKTGSQHPRRWFR